MSYGNISKSKSNWGGASNSSHNIGDIFYTTRTDNSLNGAVECNGSQYNFSDFDSNLQNLLDEGKLPYITIDEFDSMVTNQGGCDSFGYGTPKMVKIYPIGNDTEPAQMYIELTDQQYESFDTILSQCNDGDILPYRLYDIDTKELLEGYYIKCNDIDTNFFQAYDNNNEKFGYFADIPVFLYVRIDGEYIYDVTIPDPDKSQADPTTYFKVPKKIGRVLVRSQKPTADNNYTWYNVYADGWVEQGGTVKGGFSQSINWSYRNVSLPIEMIDNSYINTFQATWNFSYGGQVGQDKVYATTSSTATTMRWAYILFSSATTMFVNWQVSGYAAQSEYTKDKWNYQNIQVERCMVQLFNSTTDTAVATCNQVLADVSALNQGDYVIKTQIPTAENNYTWYRLYKSGWVEQGGIYYTAPGTPKTGTVEFPIEMLDTNYYLQPGQVVNTTGSKPGYILTLNAVSVTTTNFGYETDSQNGQGGSSYCRWQVSGMSAQGNK